MIQDFVEFARTPVGYCLIAGIVFIVGNIINGIMSTEETVDLAFGAVFVGLISLMWFIMIPVLGTVAILGWTGIGIGKVVNIIKERLS